LSVSKEESALPAGILSLDVFYHRSLGNSVVVVGDDQGEVRLFHSGNGTMLASVGGGEIH
ncbi:unnamed protein product, partial [Discosporangium mesarthrocarpum]